MFAVQEDISIQRLLGTVQDIIVCLIRKGDKELSFETLVEKLTASLIERSCRTVGTQERAGFTIGLQTELARELLLVDDMTSACDIFHRAGDRMLAELPVAVGDQGSPTVDPKITKEKSRRMIQKTEKHTGFNAYRSLSAIIREQGARLESITSRPQMQM